MSREVPLEILVTSILCVLNVFHKWLQLFFITGLFYFIWYKLEKKNNRKWSRSTKVYELYSKNVYTVDAAKKDPFCTCLTEPAISQWSFLHEISNSKYVYSKENWTLSMFYSCQFCTWALCFWVKGLPNLDIFLIRRSFDAN